MFQTNLMNRKTALAIRNLLVTVTILLFIHPQIFAQDNSPDYRNNPVWIKMMEDPNTNFYEAVKAYETFWMYHEKPNDEAEEMENAALQSSEKMNDKQKKALEKKNREKERELNKENKKKLSESDLLKLEEKREMTYQCKRFEDWMREVKPFVQNDGRILSAEERMEIYNKQKEELNNQK